MLVYIKYKTVDFKTALLEILKQQENTTEKIRTKVSKI